MRIAACTKDYGLFAALIDRAVADEHDVAVDEVTIGGEYLFEVRRAGFFFTFPDETNVGLEGDFGCAQGVERG